MLESIYNFTKYIICRLIFKDHRYELVEKGENYEAHRCKICGRMKYELIGYYGN